MGPLSLPALPSLPDLRKLRRRLLVLALVALALAAGYLLWLRDSSLVAIERVTVTGAEGEPGVEAALAAAATEMTTLHVDETASARSRTCVRARAQASPDSRTGSRRGGVRRPSLSRRGRRDILAGTGGPRHECRAAESLPVSRRRLPSGTRAAGGALILARCSPRPRGAPREGGSASARTKPDGRRVGPGSSFARRCLQGGSEVSAALRCGGSGLDTLSTSTSRSLRQVVGCFTTLYSDLRVGQPQAPVENAILQRIGGT